MMMFCEWTDRKLGDWIIAIFTYIESLSAPNFSPFILDVCIFLAQTKLFKNHFSCDPCCPCEAVSNFCCLHHCSVIDHLTSSVFLYIAHMPERDSVIFRHVNHSSSSSSSSQNRLGPPPFLVTRLTWSSSNSGLKSALFSLHFRLNPRVHRPFDSRFSYICHFSSNRQHSELLWCLSVE